MANIEGFSPEEEKSEDEDELFPNDDVTNLIIFIEKKELGDVLKERKIKAKANEEEIEEMKRKKKRRAYRELEERKKSKVSIEKNKNEVIKIDGYLNLSKEKEVKNLKRNYSETFKNNLKNLEDEESKKTLTKSKYLNKLKFTKRS